MRRPAADDGADPGGSGPVAVVLDVDLAQPLLALPGPLADDGPALAWVVVRLHTEPLGLVRLGAGRDGWDVGAVRRQLIEACRPALHDRVGAAADDLGLARLPAETSDFLRGRARVLTDAPHITVVVCTRDQPEQLGRCLDSLAELDYPSYDVLVVDNAPTTSGTRDLVSSRHGVGYGCEPRAGLSRARNRALSLLGARTGASTPPRADVVAWIDDDEVADVHWLAEIARAFHDHPAAEAVSGAVVPLCLDDQAQVWFEDYGGHSKGRGFVSDVFSPASWRRQSPLYPLPPFGVGANMAFRWSALDRIEGFDEALGAGTPTQGGEDTLAFTKLLLTGGTAVYQHSALTRHEHRRDLDGLRNQMVGYGRGLTAYYTALLLGDPRLLLPLLRLAPRALRDLRDPLGAASPAPASGFPAELVRLKRRGMLQGPARYLRARVGDARRAR